MLGALLWNRAAEGASAVGRPVLTGGGLLGFVAGALLAIPDAVIGVSLSSLSGGVILVALKEELPTEARGRFTWFALGAALYAALLFTL